MSKIAFITGGTRGIGRQIAVTLAKAGMDIAVNYRTENEDLEVEIEEEFNKKIEEGYVISQETEPNTEVPAGTKVKIKVSKGIEKAVVPNVVGKPKDEAIEMLTKDEMFTITATLTEQEQMELY